MVLGFVFTKNEKEEEEENRAIQDRYSHDNFVD